MKTITLLRHGKSDWSAPFSTDYDRPLKPRGRKDAALVGQYLLSLDLVPEIIVSSPARRARHTAELFAEAMDFDGELEWEGAIYDANSAELMSIVRRLSDSYHHAALVGHNPGFEELCCRLVGTDPNAPAGGIHMPTAAVAHVFLDVASWRDVQAGSGQLQWLTTPGDLKRSDG
jgi:phosphohistidine phosphatase